MRFLDVCRNPSALGKPDHPVPYLLIVQGNYVEIAATRLVVLLMRPSMAGKPIRDIMPVLEVNGERLVAVTPQMADLPVSEIGTVVASLPSAHSEIRRAIDVLTGDF